MKATGCPCCHRSAFCGASERPRAAWLFEDACLTVYGFGCPADRQGKLLHIQGGNRPEKHWRFIRVKYATNAREKPVAALNQFLVAFSLASYCTKNRKKKNSCPMSPTASHNLMLSIHYKLRCLSQITPRRSTTQTHRRLLTPYFDTPRIRCRWLTATVQTLPPWRWISAGTNRCM